MTEKYYFQVLEVVLKYCDNKCRIYFKFYTNTTLNLATDLPEDTELNMALGVGDDRRPSKPKGTVLGAATVSLTTEGKEKPRLWLGDHGGARVER